MISSIIWVRLGNGFEFLDGAGQTMKEHFLHGGVMKESWQKSEGKSVVLPLLRAVECWCMIV